MSPRFELRLLTIFYQFADHASFLPKNKQEKYAFDFASNQIVNDLRHPLSDPRLAPEKTDKWPASKAVLNLTDQGLALDSYVQKITSKKPSARNIPMEEPLKELGSLKELLQKGGLTRNLLRPIPRTTNRRALVLHQLIYQTS